MSTYILENDREAARLEKMSSLHAYQPSEELAAFSFQPGQTVLDAGCGSGLVARYIANQYPQVHVEGCDYSPVRIEQAKAIRQGEPGNPIRYFVSPLEDIASEDNKYDRITCRYVFEFLQNPQKVLKEFRRILKPGGQLLVIQFDGFLHNFHHENSELNSMLDLIEKNPPVDNFRGRKVPRMLRDAGFQNVDWDVKVYGWKNEELVGEKTQMYERLDFAVPLLVKTLGSEEKAKQFRDLYCQEMLTPGSVLFYNKFLVTGTKP